MAKMRGGCLCGAVRYEIDGEPFAMGACHCRDCLYVSGGAPANVMILPRAAVTITKGAPRAFTNKSARGNDVSRSFCADCGTPLFSETAAQPQFLAVKAGSLDDPGQFKPIANIWVSSAQPWAHIDPGLARFDKNPI